MDKIIYKHHQDTINNVIDKLRVREDILALIIGGSIAHGFAKETSDVDIMMLISNEDYCYKREKGDIHYFDTEASTYEGGYIDGKYICLDFMDKVAGMGSEPARYAFKDSYIAFSKIDGLDTVLDSITRYPLEKKQENIRKFYAQFEAWNWYCYEAIKHKNKYLLNHSVSNLVLFGGRMLLAHNEVLYPYHKWFLKVLENIDNKPTNLMNSIENVLIRQSEEAIEGFYRSVIDLAEWGVKDVNWPSQFMTDTELTWMDGNVSIADI
jgi:hypothetical protein